MKKTTITFLILSALLFAMNACGGKEMNNPADGSDNGPDYRNESELSYNDTTAVGETEED